MSFEIWSNEINTHIVESLNTTLPEHNFHEVIRYSVLPAGKLFRPLLVYSIAHDLGGINDDHKLLATSLELHHTYTLIHDDLPAMDDDDMRRGRASSHKKFNEWKAILAGDALINMSYELIASITENKVPKLLKTYSQLMGPKGLILGQVMDLGNENENLKNILKIHELKTARLIQLALLGSNHLSEKAIPEVDCERLGLALGINFQILDDLCELTEPLSVHEKEINPFLHFDQAELFGCLKVNTELIKDVIQKYELNKLRDYINLYLNKISTTLKNGNDLVSNHIDNQFEKEFQDLII